MGLVKNLLGDDVITFYFFPGFLSNSKEAFRYCTSLTRVDIPKSVTRIGADAFCGCSSLTQVKIPNSVTSIEEWAFRGCNSLTEVEIPDSVTWFCLFVFLGLIKAPFREYL